MTERDWIDEQLDAYFAPDSPYRAPMYVERVDGTWETTTLLDQITKHTSRPIYIETIIRRLEAAIDREVGT